MAVSGLTVRQMLLLTALLGLTVAPLRAQAMENPVAQPASVQEVQYIGAEHLSKSELQKLTNVRIGTSINPSMNELARQAILWKYQDEGRLYASVELTEGKKPSDTRVVFRIVEGPIVKVTDVQVKGIEKADTERLLEAKRGRGVVVGGNYRPQAGNEDVKILVEYYRGLGFADTRIIPEVVPSIDPAQIVVVYHVVNAKK